MKHRMSFWFVGGGIGGFWLIFLSGLLCLRFSSFLVVALGVWDMLGQGRFFSIHFL